MLLPYGSANPSPDAMGDGLAGGETLGPLANSTT